MESLVLAGFRNNTTRSNLAGQGSNRLVPNTSQTLRSGKRIVFLNQSKPRPKRHIEELDDYSAESEQEEKKIKLESIDIETQSDEDLIDTYLQYIKEDDELVEANKESFIELITELNRRELGQVVFAKKEEDDLQTEIAIQLAILDSGSPILAEDEPVENLWRTHRSPPSFRSETPESLPGLIEDTEPAPRPSSPELGDPEDLHPRFSIPIHNDYHAPEGWTIQRPLFDHFLARNPRINWETDQKPGSACGPYLFGDEEDFLLARESPTYQWEIIKVQENIVTFQRHLSWFQEEFGRSIPRHINDEAELHRTLGTSTGVDSHRFIAHWTSFNKFYLQYLIDANEEVILRHRGARLLEQQGLLNARGLKRFVAEAKAHVQRFALPLVIDVEQ